MQIERKLDCDWNVQTPKKQARPVPNEPGPVAALKRPVRFHEEKNRWLVPSQSNPTDPPYLVDMDEYDGVGQCSCEDFRYRKQPFLECGAHKVTVMKDRKDVFRCKHIRAVMKEMARLEKKRIKER